MKPGQVRTRTLFLGLLLVAGSALAQAGFSEEDLVGSYVLSSSTPNVLQEYSFTSSNLVEIGAEMLGVLRADGTGNVTGTRTFQRPIWESVDSNPIVPKHERWESIEQTVTGTYEVNADGTGIMRLSPDPRPSWDLPTERGTRIIFIGAGAEILRFALADDGRSFRFTQELRATRLDVGVYRDSHLLFVGVAETQEALETPEPEPDPRIDVLIDENAVLKAQLCEILRLLNTPQGQRVSDSPDVVDACGTAFAWNGEGTDSRRRGR